MNRILQTLRQSITFWYKSSKMGDNHGFTFIELIIVFVITTILGTIGIASLSSYNNNQQVVTAASDLKSLFQMAQARASSQVKPSQCTTDLQTPANNSSLLGYEVDFCAGGGIKPTACKPNANDYEVNAECDNGVGYINVASRTYSSALNITTTYSSYFFPVLNGGVDHGGTVQVSAFGKTVSIIISSLGIIQ